jgi:carbon storage regulator
MLVLTRKVGECVVIGGEIVLQVLEINGRRIRLGIEAPSDIAILRGELADWQSNSALHSHDHALCGNPVAGNSVHSH